MSNTPATSYSELLDNVDVAIVGGSFAGISAAYPLVRSRRKTVLIHDGSPRNRFSPESHNWLALDGATPEAVHRKGMGELSHYEHFMELRDRVVTVQHSKTDRYLELPIIEVITASGKMVRAKRVILATGMRDTFPFGINGLQDCWGKSVLQCPYCHGYEHRDVPTGILHGGGASLHQAKNLPDYASDLVYFTDSIELEVDERLDLESRGYRIVTGKVSHITHRGGLLEAVVLVNGETIAREALYVLPRSTFATDLHKQLGCGESEGPFGPYVTVDDLQETTKRGVFAAGDMTRPAFNAVWAGADGNRAGIFAHQSLVTVHNPYRGAKL